MRNIDLTINCANIQVNSYRSDLEVQLNNAYNLDDLLKQIPIEILVNNLDKDELLDEIGSDYCKDYFDLVDDPEC